MHSALLFFQPDKSQSKHCGFLKLDYLGGKILFYKWGVWQRLFDLWKLLQCSQWIPRVIHLLVSPNKGSKTISKQWGSLKPHCAAHPLHLQAL